MNSYSMILETILKYDNEKAIRLLRENIREESARAAGKGATNKLKIIKTMMKHSDGRPGFLKACEENANYYFLDGYRLFKTDSDFGFDHADEHEKFKNLEKLFTDCVTSVNDTIFLNRSDIQAFIKLSALTRSNYVKSPYFLKSESGNIYGFNPFYLLDFIDFSGTTKALASGAKAPIISDNKTALLLPVCHSKSEKDFYIWRKMIFGDPIPGENTAEKTA